MTERDSKTFAEEFLSELERSESAVVLTGAGVSTASGIPDFRGPGGLYSRFSQRTFELDFFFSETERYYEIAVEHIHTLVDRSPNVTHHMLAELEKRGLIQAVVTQNIDGLHQKAGSAKVIEFHGNVAGFHCVECRKSFGRDTVDERIEMSGVPRCDCGSVIRPEIVFFGDPIPYDAIMQGSVLARGADLFVAMGSSLTVQPAASLPLLAKNSGAELIIVNRGPTGLDYTADYRYEMPLEEFSSGVLDILRG
jgi:NAD-dependent deacetylase